MSLSRFREIAKHSPRAAILELRADLEEAVKGYAESVGMLNKLQYRGMAGLVRQLRKHELIDHPTSAILDDLRAIGNTAAHDGSRELTEQDALRFRDLAQNVIGRLTIATAAALHDHGHRTFQEPT